ncbi:MAG: N-acetyl sugar amidotransferase [Candidatus Thermoplasmatota archaeon]|nr:N-acetyl sugar amidotransferase [Candidatus Thermoplasmatota archaeon]
MSKLTDILDTQLQNRPNEVFFCKKCVLSNQRPRLTFNSDGVCSACQFAYEKQKVINWMDRENKLKDLCDVYRRNNGEFDVLVPTSGGKDSAYVAHKLKNEYGMHPLTVTWSPFMYTKIGWENFQNFLKSGFINILGSPNGHLHRKLARIGLEAVGDPFLPFIYGQMSFAFHIALKFDIKLIFFGENGEAEYGGSTKNNYLPYMPIEDWADLYWKGATVDDIIAWGVEKNIINQDDYNESDLIYYRPPPVDELKKHNIQMHWFSYYHKWVPQENYYYCAENTGFQANPDGRSEGTYSKYASLDDKLDGLHYWLGFLKFGIGRATSDAAHEIRDGHITREEAVSLVNRYDGEFPIKYFKESLNYLGINEQIFMDIIEKYRHSSPHLWEKIDDEWRLKHKVK